MEKDIYINTFHIMCKSICQTVNSKICKWDYVHWLEEKQKGKLPQGLEYPSCSLIETLNTSAYHTPIYHTAWQRLWRGWMRRKKEAKEEEKERMS